MKATLLTVGLVLLLALLAACDSGTPMTPAPVVEPTPTWEEATDLPEDYTSEQVPGEVRLSREEGQALFSVRLVGREGSTSADFQGNPLKSIHFLVELRNNTRHDISKASGTILFNDSSGMFLDGDRVEQLPPVKAGEAVTITHAFLDTETVPVRATLRETPLNTLRVKFQPYFITFQDGTGQEIIYEQ
jgi:hypothetical protein